ncbi:glycosyltransferase family 4 protein [Bradyrhizobium sp. CCBAU 51745]|uniref:glycosyltransferase family 4 protein n=1 Tax=Bradyrhizobium sp. CCBAU 51745 TaxID=1325099 RepID=UPI002304EE85|nr:glycosyltransferase family 4 protein [Bradyrhizobium sp. CCBAU 51745]
MMGEKRNIVIAAAFPPPLHGLAKISESIASDLAEFAHVHRCDLSSRSLRRSWGYHWRRVSSVLMAAVGVLRNGLRPNPCLYIPADGGLGLVYTILLTGLARLSQQAIVIHHHSFSAIDQRRWLMSALVSIAGNGAVHVFLCRMMQLRFRKNYRGEWRGLISSNAVHLSAAPDRRLRERDEIRIGLLSNLTTEKGLYLFLDLLRACVQCGLPITGMLAGPIQFEEDRAAVESAQRQLGARLIHVGALYGPDKDEFLAELDVFVFPTGYRNEAQPNVVFEAMSAGTAVITFARGCLSEDVSEDCGPIIDPSDDFVSAACAQIKSWSDDRKSLAAAKAAAKRRFVALRATAAADYGNLLCAIADLELPGS